jgi:3-oxoacyl-[acyl-carrier protein] reductase
MSRETVLVTGASRGIGRAVACRLARAGYDLVLHCRHRLELLEALAEELRRQYAIQIRLLQFDLADREGARAALERDIKSYGAYYGVVCNAGCSRDAAFPALTGEDWDQVVHTNLDGLDGSSPSPRYPG